MEKTKKYMSEELRELCNKVIDQQTSRFVGEIKTQIDASVQDPEQRKAMKDIFSRLTWASNVTTQKILEEIFISLYLILEKARGPQKSEEPRPYWVKEDIAFDVGIYSDLNDCDLTR